MYDVPLYPGSAEEARKHGELEQWRESFRANCACAGISKRDSTLETELQKAAQRLYEKVVPAPVREYIDEADAPKKPEVGV